MPKKPLPTEQEVRSYIRDRRNWGRWGKDDQRGAINLITPAKRTSAARLVKTGRSVSLSRPFPKDPGMNNALNMAPTDAIYRELEVLGFNINGASYALLLKIPSGRVYVFYNHNTDNIREVIADKPAYPSGYCKRVDSLGHFVFMMFYALGGVVATPVALYLARPKLVIANVSRADGLTVLLDGKPIAERVHMARREGGLIVRQDVMIAASTSRWP